VAPAPTAQERTGAPAPENPATEPPSDSSDPYSPAFDLVGRFGLGSSSAGRSIGTPQHGYLAGGIALASAGPLEVLPFTRQRGFVWGTQALTSLLHRSAEAVSHDHPGSILRVGNLSRPGGGDIPPSVSHNSGRDADIAFFAFDRMGRGDLPPASLVHFDDNGVSDSPESIRGRFEFDTARNWSLVQHWLADPDVVVQWIFIAVPLRNLLLDHALRIGAPASVRDRAMRVLVQPRESSPHADHFHLRIACPADDRPACIDGPGRTARAHEAQVDALLQMYREGTPAEQRYARELLTLPADGADFELPPVESED